MFWRRVLICAIYGSHPPQFCNPWIVQVGRRMLKRSSLLLLIGTENSSHTVRMANFVSSPVSVDTSTVTIDNVDSHANTFKEYLRSCIRKGSKVISRDKGEKIVKLLKGTSFPEPIDPHFRFWVKKRKFRLMDYPSLGLKDVLCLPTKETVCYSLNIIINSMRIA